jgi:transposase
MCGWLTAVSITLRPLYDLMKELLLQSKVICTDDTPVKVQDRKKKKNIKTGRIWIYIGDKSYPFNLFDYTEGRGRAGPMQFLAGFKGYLQGDCFSGNEALCTASGALHCACNAHARRYFVKSLPNNKSASECALTFFQKLYKIESDARDFDLNTVDLQRMRQEESVPVLNEFKQWLDKESLSMLPQSSFGKAIFYCLNNWEALIRYTEDGDIAIDNNCSEREMKTVAVGRKNWYFLGSDAGGETAEVLMSLISTCKRHGVEPYAYLKDVITRLTNEPGYKRTDLLPNNWQPQQSISVNPEMAIA